MRILMYRWKAYNYRDIEQTFRMMGHSVDNIEQPLGNYDIDPEFEKKIEQLLLHGDYDMVFTVNYFALISNVCEKLGVKYVSMSRFFMTVIIFLHLTRPIIMNFATWG